MALEGRFGAYPNDAAMKTALARAREQGSVYRIEITEREYNDIEPGHVLITPNGDHMEVICLIRAHTEPKHLAVGTLRDPRP